MAREQLRAKIEELFNLLLSDVDISILVVQQQYDWAHGKPREEMVNNIRDNTQETIDAIMALLDEVKVKVSCGWCRDMYTNHPDWSYCPWCGGNFEDNEFKQLNSKEK